MSPCVSTDLLAEHLDRVCKGESALGLQGAVRDSTWYFLARTWFCSDGTKRHTSQISHNASHWVSLGQSIGLSKDVVFFKTKMIFYGHTSWHGMQDLSSRPGIKPRPPGVLTTGWPREVPDLSRRKRSESWFSYTRCKSKSPGGAW